VVTVVEEEVAILAAAAAEIAAAEEDNHTRNSRAIPSPNRITHKAVDNLTNSSSRDPRSTNNPSHKSTNSPGHKSTSSRVLSKILNSIRATTDSVLARTIQEKTVEATMDNVLARIIQVATTDNVLVRIIQEAIMDSVLARTVQEKTVEVTMDRVLARTIQEATMDSVLAKTVQEKTVEATMDRVLGRTVQERTAQATMDRVLAKTALVRTVLVRIVEATTDSVLERTVPVKTVEATTDSVLGRIVPAKTVPVRTVEATTDSVLGRIVLVRTVQATMEVSTARIHDQEKTEAGIEEEETETGMAIVKVHTTPLVSEAGAHEEIVITDLAITTTGEIGIATAMAIAKVTGTQTGTMEEAPIGDGETEEPIGAGIKAVMTADGEDMAKATLHNMSPSAPHLGSIGMVLQASSLRTSQRSTFPLQLGQILRIFQPSPWKDPPGTVLPQLRERATKSKQLNTPKRSPKPPSQAQSPSLLKMAP
jgi:hypothetical protein